MGETLKPCAHCGCDDLETSPFRMPTAWVIRCGNPYCNAEMRGATREEVLAKWERRTEPSRAAEGVGTGAVVVPREPTADMLSAAAFAVSPLAGQKFNVMVIAAYKAMLAAAPHSHQPEARPDTTDEAIEVRRAARLLIEAMCNYDPPIIERAWLPNDRAPNRRHANMYSMNPPQDVIDRIAAAQSRLILALDRWNPDAIESQRNEGKSTL